MQIGDTCPITLEPILDPIRVSVLLPGISEPFIHLYQADGILQWLMHTDRLQNQHHITDPLSRQPIVHIDLADELRREHHLSDGNEHREAVNIIKALIPGVSESSTGAISLWSPAATMTTIPPVQRTAPTIQLPSAVFIPNAPQFRFGKIMTLMVGHPDRFLSFSAMNDLGFDTSYLSRIGTDFSIHSTETNKFYLYDLAGYCNNRSRTNSCYDASANNASFILHYGDSPTLFTNSLQALGYTRGDDNQFQGKFYSLTLENGQLVLHDYVIGSLITTTLASALSTRNIVLPMLDQVMTKIPADILFAAQQAAQPAQRQSERKCSIM